MKLKWGSCNFNDIKEGNRQTSWGQSNMTGTLKLGAAIVTSTMLVKYLEDKKIIPEDTDK